MTGHFLFMPHYQVTEALILKTIKYDDTSVIVHAYTRLFGLTAFMVRGVRKKEAKIRMAFLQPMNLTQIACCQGKAGKLGYIGEISLSPMYRSIPFDIKKNTIMMFINEILYKTLKEEHPNEPLFDYLKNFLVELDRFEDNFSNSHLFFMAGLTQFFGIHPNFEKKGWFDLKEGLAVTTKPSHEYIINNEEITLFQALFSVPINEQHQIKITALERRTLLDMLLTYYALHIPGMETLRSRNILHHILH